MFASTVYFRHLLLEGRPTWKLLASSLCMLAGVLLLCCVGHSLLFLYYMYPVFSAVDCETALAQVAEGIPDGFQCNISFTQGATTCNTKEQVVLRLPSLYMRLWDEHLPHPFYDSIAATVDDLRDAADKFDDHFVHVREFQVNDSVLVRSDNDGFLPTFAGSFAQGTVIRVHPNRRLLHFLYEVVVEGVAVNVTAFDMRSSGGSSIVFNPPEDVADNIQDDLSKRLDAPVVFFFESKFAVVDGYSFHHNQYWSYLGHKLDMDLVQDISLSHIKIHSPLWSFLNVACTVNDEGAVCSKPTAKANMTQKYCKSNSFAWKLKVVASGVAVYLSAQYIVPKHMIALVVAQIPLLYVIANLFRHVDTPTSSLLVISVVCTRTLLPFVLFDEASAVVMKLFVENGIWVELKPILDAVSTHWYAVGVLWLLYATYVVLDLRWHKEYNELREAVKLRQDLNSRAPETAGPPGEDIMCRICFGDALDGRLISPCLCKGSIRFVHIGCLNQWRFSSTNPKSFYQCDQCHYRYFFQRTYFATVIRSALLLHVMTLALFVVSVLVSSALMLVVDQSFMEGTLEEQIFGDDFPGRVETNLYTELNRTMELNSLEPDDVVLVRDYIIPQFLYLVGTDWYGIKLVHVISGFTIVGMLGMLLSSYAFSFTLVGARVGRVRENGFIMVALLIGIFKVLKTFYQLFKQTTGYVLRSAESHILEVGTSYEASMAARSTVVPKDTCSSDDEHRDSDDGLEQDREDDM